MRAVRACCYIRWVCGLVHRHANVPLHSRGLEANNVLDVALLAANRNIGTVQYVVGRSNEVRQTNLQGRFVICAGSCGCEESRQPKRYGSAEISVR
jgi:hypothetical protein